MNGFLRGTLVAALWGIALAGCGAGGRRGCWTGLVLREGAKDVV